MGLKNRSNEDVIHDVLNLLHERKVKGYTKGLPESRLLASVGLYYTDGRERLKCLYKDGLIEIELVNRDGTPFIANQRYVKRKGVKKHRGSIAKMITITPRGEVALDLLGEQRKMLGLFLEV